MSTTTRLPAALKAEADAYAAELGISLNGVIVSFQQIDTVAAGQSVTSSMRLLGM